MIASVMSLISALTRIVSAILPISRRVSARARSSKYLSKSPQGVAGERGAWPSPCAGAGSGRPPPLLRARITPSTSSKSTARCPCISDDRPLPRNGL